MSVTPTRTLPYAPGDAIELYYAEMEAARNDVEDAYFRARADDDTALNRRMFKAGFERAFRHLWRPPVSAGESP